MEFETFLAVLLCLIGIIAGVAPAKYPQYSGVATFILWAAVVALIVLIAMTVRVAGVKQLAGMIQPSHVILLGLVVAAGGVVWQMAQPVDQLSVASSTVIAPGAVDPSPVAQNSVLLPPRFYSAKNKEEVANRLDAIAGAMNKPCEEMFLLVLQATGGYTWSRQEAAPTYVQKLDEIKTKAAHMDAVLYDDLIQNERDYRQEMNAILFPKDPITKFRMAVDDYRNALSVWITLRGSVQDDPARQDFQQVVMASQRSLIAARDELLKWVSQRQELIGQTRRALRS